LAHETDEALTLMRRNGFKGSSPGHINDSPKNSTRAE